LAENIDTLLAALQAEWPTSLNAVRDLSKHLDNERVFQALIEAMGSQNISLATKAAEVLAPTGRAEVHQRLWEYLRGEDDQARYVAVHGLWAAREPGIIGTLIELLRQDSSTLVHFAVLDCLAESNDPGIVEPLVEIVRTASDGAKLERAIRMLTRRGVSQSADPMADLFWKPEVDSRVCETATKALIKLNYAPLVPVLKKALSTENPNAAGRMVAARMLGELQERTAIPLLVAALQHDPDHGVRQEAANSLGLLKADEAEEAIIAATQDESAFVRTAAVRALGKIGGSRAVQHLIKLLGEGDNYALLALRERQEPEARAAAEEWLAKKRAP
jgi:HEAT repeat protein